MIDPSNIGKHLTIAFDVVNSRLYTNKNTLWTSLRDLCGKLNEKYDEYLRVPFYIKDGDSIVGVLNDFPSGFKIYKDLRKFSWKHNIEFYYGMGFGTFDTDRVINGNEINGSSVINAFSAINYAKKSNSKKNNPVSFFAYDDLDIVPYKTLNSLISLIYNEFSGRTPKQKKIIKFMELNSELTYEEIGINMEYSKNGAKENISKILSRADYDINKQLQKDVLDLLKKMQLMLKGGLI